MVFLNKFKKKYVVKIPKTSQIIYCEKKSILVIKGPLQTRSLKLPVKVLMVPSINSLIVTDKLAFNSTLSFSKKKILKLQGTTVSKIKQILVETTYTLYQKLNLVGVGYRVFSYDSSERQVYFKLGYSHFVYSRIPTSLNSFCYKFTKLFLFGNCSLDVLTQTAARIRSYKRPEPYKGKGILYDQESIKLKKGKKI